MDYVARLWLPVLGVILLVTRGLALHCYECLHMEMSSNNDIINELLRATTVSDLECKLEGDEFTDSNPHSAECEWTDDYHFLRGSDMEDFYYPDYDTNDTYTDYQNYMRDYYYNLHQRGAEVTCQKDVGTASYEMYGMSMEVKIWGRGCEALPASEGYPVDGCTDQLSEYQHSMLYILHQETQGLMDLEGEICICQNDYCNAAPGFKSSSVLMAALLLLASLLI